jgi:ABC-type polysaccharide/polyol phosphate export permease
MEYTFSQFQFCNLLQLLVKRDLSARDRRAYLGYAWAVLEPLLLAIVYTFIFTILVGSSDPLYPVKIILGVIGWSLFARSLTSSTKSLGKSVGCLFISAIGNHKRFRIVKLSIPTQK